LVLTAGLFPSLANAAEGAETRLARARCLCTAAAVGLAVSMPAVIPLWSAGAAKGLAVATGITDAYARANTPSTLDPARARVLFERDNLWFMVGMALLGSMVFTGLHMPGFTLAMVSLLAVATLATDGLGSGACSTQDNGALPLPFLLRNAGIGAGLLILAALPLPLLMLPTLGGAALILIAMRMAPAFPIIPGLGFTDLPANFKRAGILQTASWPMIYVSSLALGGAVIMGILHLAPAITRSGVE